MSNIYIFFHSPLQEGKAGPVRLRGFHLHHKQTLSPELRLGPVKIVQYSRRGQILCVMKIGLNYSSRRKQELQWPANNVAWKNPGDRCWSSPVTKTDRSHCQ